jgi:hypothetical protein
MNTNSIIKWTTKGLAIFGALAILFVITNAAVSLFATSTSSIGKVMFNEGYDMTSSYMETSEAVFFDSAPIAPRDGKLFDEAIAAEVETKIIKTGTLDLVVDSAQESLSNIETLVAEKEGFVQNSTIREHQDGTKSGYMTVRVPADNFESSLKEIKSFAVVVERETTSSDDVTEDYIDLSARLKNAQAQEARYTEILDVATTVEEILQIETALGNIRGYIESLTGQLQYLDSLTGFSTITINLSEEPVITIGGKEFRPGTSIKEAGQTLIAVGQWTIVAIIWTVIIGSGVGLPLAFIVWLLIKAIRTRRSKK